MYYKFFNFVTGLTVPQRTAPIRVMNRRYIDAYNCLNEKNRFPQGLDEWFGFKKKYVIVQHFSRSAGKSSYNFFSRTALALDGILSFSDKPLRLILYSGILAAVVSFVVMIYLIIGRLLYNIFVPGYVSIISLILAGFGIQMACMGITGLYIGRILKETQDRPLYVMRKKYQVPRR
jgi:dolichol-phosphate mannosyltransferase